MPGKPIITVDFDENGKAVSARNIDGKELTVTDYGNRENETQRTIVTVGILATKNFCCWRKIGGKWFCVPC